MSDDQPTTHPQQRASSNNEESDGSSEASDFLSKLTAPKSLLGLSVLSLIVGKAVGNSTLATTSRKALANLVVANSTTTVLKHLIGRERPDENSPGADFHGPTTKDKYHSLPSGHATAITAVVTALPKATHADRLAKATATAAIVAVGAARIDRDRHRLSDIIAGCFVGFASSAVVTKLLKGNGVKK